MSMGRDDELGFRRLYRCDPRRGSAGTNNGLLVPTALATQLNALRVTLSDECEVDEFVRAAAPVPYRLLDPVVRRKVYEALGEIPADEARAEKEKEKAKEWAAEDDPEPEAPAPAPAPSPPASPAPPPPPAVPQPGDACEHGHYVRICDAKSLDAWGAKYARHLAIQGTRDTEEKRELLRQKTLLDRGGTRLVKLVSDWQRALRALREEMPNFAGVVDAVTRQCALSVSSRSPLRIQPLLLAGSPGVGKTYFATRLAEALELPRFLYNLESAESNSILLGSEKHWSNSQPGELYKLVVEGELANPLVIADELDKAPSGQGRHYHPRDSLIPVLERSTSTCLRDKSADLVFDGSWVVYVATANSLRPIEAHMLSRFDLHHVPELTPQQAVGVVRGIHERICIELRLDFGRPQQALVQELAMLANPRLIERLLRKAFARAVERRGPENNALQLRDVEDDEAGQGRLH